MGETWRAGPLVWGRGPRQLEIFLEPTCPFSARAFGKLDELLEAAGEDRLTVTIRLLSQPWHLFSGVVVRCIHQVARQVCPTERRARDADLHGRRDHRPGDGKWGPRVILARGFGAFVASSHHHPPARVVPVTYIVRVPYEEAMMRDHFGPLYDDYCKRTGRLLPKLCVGGSASG